MNYDEILNLVLECDAMSGHESDLVVFARAIEQLTLTNQKVKWYQEGVESEREACAKIADHLSASEYDVGAFIGRAIRSRGE